MILTNETDSNSTNATNTPNSATSTATLDLIVNASLYTFTAIDYIFFIIILYFMIKSKEKASCYTVYKYQTLPISAIYIFTKLPLFSKQMMTACQNLSVYRNFFFILLVSIQAFSIIFTFLTIYTPNFINNHAHFVNTSLFFISWFPPVVALVIAYITIDTCIYRDVGKLCVYETGLLVTFRTYLYAVYFILYVVFLFFIGKAVKKSLLEETGDVYLQEYKDYNKKLQVFFKGSIAIFIMLLVTVAAVILGQFRNNEFLYFMERMLINICEALLPIMICYYNCLTGKHISYIFSVFCCKKREDLSISEMTEVREGSIASDFDELTI